MLAVAVNKCAEGACAMHGSPRVEVRKGGGVGRIRLREFSV